MVTLQSIIKKDILTYKKNGCIQIIVEILIQSFSEFLKCVCTYRTISMVWFETGKISSYDYRVDIEAVSSIPGISQPNVASLELD